jgi:hypothetical protein
MEIPRLPSSDLFRLTSLGHTGRSYKQRKTTAKVVITQLKGRRINGTGGGGFTPFPFLPVFIVASKISQSILLPIVYFTVFVEYFGKKLRHWSLENRSLFVEMLEEMFWC